MKSPLLPSPSLKIAEELSGKAKSNYRKEYKAVLSKKEVREDDIVLFLLGANEIGTLRKLLDEWIESLSLFREDKFAQGIATGWIELDSYLEVLEQTNDDYWKD